MTKYRLLDNIDWAALQEAKVQIEVSDAYIILKPLKPGASLVILAQAVKSRQIRMNGQPASTEPVITSAEPQGEPI